MIEESHSISGLSEIIITDDKDSGQVTIDQTGFVVISTEGGGRGYLTYPGSTVYVQLSVLDAIKLRDFFNKYVIDIQDGCEHTNRVIHSESLNPNFSCSECGYGT